MSFKFKTFLNMIFIGLVPGIIIASVALYFESKFLGKQVFNQLESLREVKKDAVNQYLERSTNQIESMAHSDVVIHAAENLAEAFNNNAEIYVSVEDKKRLERYYQTVFIPEFEKHESTKSNISVPSLVDPLSPMASYLQLAYIVDNPHKLGKKHDLDRAPGRERYHQIHEEIHPYLHDYLERFGYYDIFIIDTNGNVIYSVFKEIDFAISLTSGPAIKSGLAKAYQKVRTMKKDVLNAQIVDFNQYQPSYNAPAGFMSSPIFSNGENIGALIFQFPIDRLNKIMSQRAGLGETGETYLIGSDALMRSDSFLEPEHHSVEASFRNPDKGHVKTEAYRRGIAGETGIDIITDYNGHSVLSAFSPLGFRDLNWLIITEMDEAEALGPVKKLQIILFSIVALSGILVLYLAWRLCNRVLKPLGGEPQEISSIARGIADGDLQFAFKEACENTSIYGAMGKMNAELKRLIGEIGSASEQQASAAEELTAITQSTSNTLDLQNQKTTLVATAVEEMNATAKDVSQSTDSTAASAMCAREQVYTSTQEVVNNSQNMRKMAETLSGGQEKIDQLRAHTDDIVEIVQTITGIADQTNLLALNAAIEAARAGEQGRGFAVVSEEVRSLAGHTQKATEKISRMIETLLDAAEQASKVMDHSVELAMTLSTESSSTADRLEAAAAAVDDIARRAEQIAAASSQQTVTAADIGSSISEVSDLADQSTESVSQISSASEELSMLSVRLQDTVKLFKL